MKAYKTLFMLIVVAILVASCGVGKKNQKNLSLEGLWVAESMILRDEVEEKKLPYVADGFLIAATKDEIQIYYLPGSSRVLSGTKQNYKIENNNLHIMVSKDGTKDITATIERKEDGPSEYLCLHDFTLDGILLFKKISLYKTTGDYADWLFRDVFVENRKNYLEKQISNSSDGVSNKKSDDTGQRVTVTDKNEENVENTPITSSSLLEGFWKYKGLIINGTRYYPGSKINIGSNEYKVQKINIIIHFHKHTFMRYVNGYNAEADYAKYSIIGDKLSMPTQYIAGQKYRGKDFKIINRGINILVFKSFALNVYAGGHVAYEVYNKISPEEAENELKNCSIYRKKFID